MSDPPAPCVADYRGADTNTTNIAMFFVASLDHPVGTRAVVSLVLTGVFLLQMLILLGILATLCGCPVILGSLGHRFVLWATFQRRQLRDRQHELEGPSEEESVAWSRWRHQRSAEWQRARALRFQRQFLYVTGHLPGTEAVPSRREPIDEPSEPRSDASSCDESLTWTQSLRLRCLCLMNAAIDSTGALWTAMNDYWSYWSGSSYPPYIMSHGEGCSLQQHTCYRVFVHDDFHAPTHGRYRKPHRWHMKALRLARWKRWLFKYFVFYLGVRVMIPVFLACHRAAWHRWLRLASILRRRLTLLFRWSDIIMKQHSHPGASARRDVRPSTSTGAPLDTTVILASHSASVRMDPPLPCHGDPTAELPAVSFISPSPPRRRRAKHPHTRGAVAAAVTSRELFGSPIDRSMHETEPYHHPTPAAAVTAIPAPTTIDEDERMHPTGCAAATCLWLRYQTAFQCYLVCRWLLRLGMQHLPCHTTWGDEAAGPWDLESSPESSASSAADATYLDETLRCDHNDPTVTGAHHV